LPKWLADARALASPQLVTVLVGTKTDREDERQVEWNEANAWANDNDIHYLETSSLTDFQTELPFLLLARSILLAIESGALDPERPGSGVSYGDRLLRRVRSGSGWGVRIGAGDDRGSHLTEMLKSRSGGRVRALKPKCCNS